MQVVRKKASLPDISMGKSTEPIKTRQYVTAETLTQIVHHWISET